MTTDEAKFWSNALVKACFSLHRDGDMEGADFITEWCFLLEEFIHGFPIQRKPY